MKKYVLFLILWVPFAQYAQKKTRKYPNIVKLGLIIENNSGYNFEYIKDFRSVDVGIGAHIIRYEATYAPQNKNFLSSGYSYPKNHFDVYSLMLGRHFVVKDYFALHFQAGVMITKYKEVISWEYHSSWGFSGYNYKYDNFSKYGFTSRLSLEIPFSNSIGFSMGGYYSKDSHQQHYGVLLDFMFGNLSKHK